MTRRCFDYKDGVDTGGNPIMKRRCYCGTTACLKITNFILPTISALVCSISGEPVEEHLGHYHCKSQFCWAEHCEPISIEQFNLARVTK